MRESEIQREILSYLKARGILHWRCSLGGVRLGSGAFAKNPMKGFPDIAGLYCKQFFTIECKTKKGKLSKEQIEWSVKLSEQGVYCVVARGLDDVIQAMRNIATKTQEVKNNEFPTEETP